MTLKIGDMVKLSQMGVDGDVRGLLPVDFGFIVAFESPSGYGGGAPEPRVSWVRCGLVVDHYSWEVEAVSET